MPDQFIDNMNQEATYWPPGQSDGQGGIELLAPILINCRWQWDSVLYRDAERREQTSNAVVYADRPLEIKGWLVLGDYTASADPQEVDDAFEIMQIYRTPNLDNTLTLEKVML